MGRGPDYYWTDKETEELKKLKESGLHLFEIAERLGRTRKSVIAKWERMTLPMDTRLAYLRKKRLDSKRYRRTKTGDVFRAVRFVPPELFDDLNARQAAPRDLTGILMGDPPKGFSALERR